MFRVPQTVAPLRHYAAHQKFDDFWKKQSLVYNLNVPKVPILHVAGWWDQEDFCGPLVAYEVLENNDKENKNFIAIGPWNHGGWSGGKGESMGRINFGTPTSEKFRKEIQAPFFAYYLKGKGNGQFSEAVTFQTGSNTWISYDKWPPTNITVTKNLYMNSNGKLLFDPPGEANGFDEYLSDPFHPVPYRSRPVEATYGPGSRLSIAIRRNLFLIFLKPWNLIL